MSRTVLVIGATGILAPAAAELVARGVHVLGVSRGRHGAPAGVTPVEVDAHDAVALSNALAGFSWDDAVVYGPAVTDETLSSVQAATSARCVLVRPSSAADPDHGDTVVPADTLQLGWTNLPPHRWHTPEEVSRAALAALDDGEPRTLGTVRPWDDRP